MTTLQNARLAHRDSHQFTTMKTQPEIINGLSEAEETKRGELLVSFLKLKESKQETAHGKISFDPPRYSTEWGTKTALGIFRSIEAIIKSGE